VGPGVYNVTLDVVDEQLNTNTCQVTVTVLDNTPPTVTPPPNLVVPNMLWVPPASLLGVSVTDNCGVAQTNYLGQTAVGDSPRLITRAFEGVDIHGNRATNTQTITVLSTRPDPMVYEPFAGYTNGSLIGQAYAGSGFALPGAWSTSAGDVSVSDAGGLTYASGPLTLLTTGGKATTPAAGFNAATASLDVSPAGPFGSQGLVDGGLIGGPSVNGTLYYSFLARNASTSLDGTEDFAGVQLYRNGAEVFAAGNNWDAWAYSTFGIGGDGDLLRPSDNGWKAMDNDIHLFVVKIQFAAGGDDTVTVWMDPDLTQTEAGQPNTVYRRTVTGDASFNQVAVRSGSSDNNNSWDFDEIRFAGTWGDVTPTAPAITVQPVASHRIAVGGSASMSVAAVGSPTVMQVWVQNGNVLSNEAGTTLTINNAQAANSGAYQAFVFNAYGQVTSAVSTLIVDVTPPTITQCATNRTIVLGTNCGAVMPDLTGEVQATDDSGEPVTIVAQSPAPGSALAVGANVVTLYVTDNYNNTNTCVATVTLQAGGPVVADYPGVTYTETTFKLASAKLVTNATHPEGRQFAFGGVLSPSTNGTAVTYDGSNIVYTPAPAFVGRDELSYTLVDCAGITATNKIVVDVQAPPAGFNKVSLQVLDTGAELVFQGIPGRTYDVLRSTNFTVPYLWHKIADATATNNGKFGYLDAEKPPGALYRTREQ